MKKILYGICLLLVSAQLTAQKQHFDLVSYTAPKGWKKVVSKRAVTYSINDTKEKTWCVLAIYANVPSKGDIDTDLLSEWNLLQAPLLK